MGMELVLYVGCDRREDGCSVQWVALLGFCREDRTMRAHDYLG